MILQVLLSFIQTILSAVTSVRVVVCRKLFNIREKRQYTLQTLKVHVLFAYLFCKTMRLQIIEEIMREFQQICYVVSLTEYTMSTVVFITIEK